MIIFRPSIGNNTSVVSVNVNGEWYGKSLGNYVIKEVSTPTSPFTKVDSKLYSTADLAPEQQASTWFYKDVTDFDFITGNSYYRCLYIGVESDISGDNDFSEIIGTITASATHTSPTSYPSTLTLGQANDYLDNTVVLEMWYEGVYNILSSKNSLSIDDEYDSTGVLDDAVAASGNLWQTNLVLNTTLVPGQYIKIWVKITPTFDRELLDFGGYTYTYTIGDLVIENIVRATGRLNISQIYCGTLDSGNGNVLVNQVLPLQFEYNSILKIIEKNGYSNVFHLDTNNKMKNLIIKQNIDISDNKYINYDFSSLTGSITGDNSYTFARVIECLNSGDTQVLNVVNNNLKPYLNRKTIVDIFLSKSDRNDAFIFFNELVNNQDSDYQDNFNHTLYSWNFGVIRLNLNFANKSQFDEIEAGLENTFDMEILDTSQIFTLKENHFATSVIQQDDLYTSLGFNIEDCRVDEKKSYITYIWEKDIVKPVIDIVDDEEVKTVKIYNSLLPKDENNKVTTITNRARTDAYLVFNDLSTIDTTNTEDIREVVELRDGIKYLKTGSSHEKVVDIGTSSVSFDLVTDVDEFSTTIGLSIDKESIETTTVATTASTAAPEETVTYNVGNPSHNHLLYQVDFDQYNTPELVYQQVTKTYYEEVSTRNDGLLTTVIENSSNVVPLTGSSEDILTIYLNKILQSDSLTGDTEDFAHIVKISGDGNTALVISKNIIQVDENNNVLYNFEISAVYLFKRCSGLWKLITEITPKNINGFTFGKFFSIEDENKVDISNDGTAITISAVASTVDIPGFGPQYNYNGYAVYFIKTSDDWATYSQTRIDTDIAMLTEQREFLEDDLSFGYSVAISDDAKKIAIGSPSEFFSYVETDNQNAILNEYEVRNNGAVYLFTTESTSPSGVAASGQDLEFGMTIAGSGAEIPLYFLQRIIPNDSSDISINGVPQECIRNGIYDGKRFGEKIRMNTDGTKIAVGAKNDNSKGLHAGAVYTILTPVDDCVLTIDNTFIKVTPNIGYEDQQFSSYSMDLSRDGGTLIVGDANYDDLEGRAHVFDIDWLNMFTGLYTEVVIPTGSFDDTSYDSLPRKFGQLVHVSEDGNIIFVKDTYSIRIYSSTDERGNVARSFTYDKKVVGFDKVEDTSALTTTSGNSLDANNAGDVFIVGFKKINTNTEDRAFIQDYNPDSYNSITSASCGISGTNQAIEVPYLIDIDQVPHEYTESEIVGEISPSVTIGNEVQEFDFEDEFKDIAIIHCNGSENLVALTIQYNFHSRYWKLRGFTNDGSETSSLIAPNIVLSPYYPNAITINMFRKQVNGYSCGKRYMLTYDICVNGNFLYSGQTFTFDTTNAFVVTVNPTEGFSASLSYWDVREFLTNPLQYNKSMFGAISNTIWGELEEEVLNSLGVNEKGFETFIYKRHILLHGIDWDNEDDVIIPIVLQGNGYAVNSTYSSNLTRSKFNFSNIDINNPSFGFTYEGSGDVINWRAEKYDYNKDRLVLWVRLENWKGQRLVMYYGDTSVVKSPAPSNIYDNFYGCWLMDEFRDISRLRYVDVQIYDGGEALILGRNGNYFLNQINKQYLFGTEKVYKSNKFDIYYDDLDVHIDREDKVADFIKTNVKLFVPGFMEIRNISSSKPADIEADQVDNN